MRALALVPGTTHLTMVERPAPGLPGPGEVLVDVLEVGICGTDREEVAGGRADAPPGQDELVIGHEMLGRIAAVGAGVDGLTAGSLAVLTVRRECGRCAQCASGRSDMCSTGDYTERGIKGRDGYETEQVCDLARYVVPVPAALSACAILTEPLTIAEKAIAETQQIQAARMPGMRQAEPVALMAGRRCLVAGLGPVGLLAVLALRLRGAEVLGMDIVTAENPRVALLKELGGTYLDGQSVTLADLDKTVGRVDLIFEATGAPKLEFELMDALGINGIYVVTGVPGGDRPITIDGAELMRRLVLGNQVLVGSVNASIEHFHSAVSDLMAAEERWPGLAAKFITQRVPAAQFAQAFAAPGDEEIKTVVTWTSNAGSPR